MPHRDGVEWVEGSLEEAAALEVFGLSSAASTALVFVVIAIAVTMATDSGDPQGIPP